MIDIRLLANSRLLVVEDYWKILPHYRQQEALQIRGISKDADILVVAVADDDGVEDVAFIQGEGSQVNEDRGSSGADRDVLPPADRCHQFDGWMNGKL